MTTGRINQVDALLHRTTPRANTLHAIMWACCIHHKVDICTLRNAHSTHVSTLSLTMHRGDSMKICPPYSNRHGCDNSFSSTHPSSQIPEVYTYVFEQIHIATTRHFQISSNACNMPWWHPQHEVRWLSEGNANCQTHTRDGKQHQTRTMRNNMTNRLLIRNRNCALIKCTYHCQTRMEQTNPQSLMKHKMSNVQ